MVCLSIWSDCLPGSVCLSVCRNFFLLFLVASVSFHINIQLHLFNCISIQHAGLFHHKYKERGHAGAGGGAIELIATNGSITIG